MENSCADHVNIGIGWLLLGVYLIEHHEQTRYKDMPKRRTCFSKGAGITPQGQTITIRAAWRFWSGAIKTNLCFGGVVGIETVFFSR